MTEYISREAVLSKCVDIWNNADETTQTGVDTINTIDEITDFIESLPSADAQPVVHAYWIKLPKALNPNENPYKCSNCGHVLSFMNGYPKSKYCDDCGARMDIIYEDDKVRAIKVTGWDNDVRDWQPLPEPPKQRNG